MKASAKREREGGLPPSASSTPPPLTSSSAIASPSPAPASPAPLCVPSELLETTAHLLRRSKQQRFPLPSLAMAPVVPLPLWQRVVLSALHSRDEAVTDWKRAHGERRKLDRELTRYHADVRAREERLRQQQREARARLGVRLSACAARYWNRRGESFQQMLKAEFDVRKARRDSRRQEDLLRETEELTRKLLESLVAKKHTLLPSTATDEAKSAANGAPSAAQSTGRLQETAVGDTDTSSIQHLEHQSDSDVSRALSSKKAEEDGDVANGTTGEGGMEESLSLLDTQNGTRPLRHYQRSALHWMVHLFESKLNGILADEMGLGKTVQTIALLCYFAEYRNDWGPHLIVVPTTVVLNWKSEFHRWAPGLKVLTYIGSAKERLQLRRGWTSEDAFHVCITSYNLVVKDRAVFRRRPWGFLVLDEAHHVKNFMSKKWQSLFDLQAEYRLLLTGTPLQNSMMELWSLLHFLLPAASAFRSNEEFKEWFSNPLDEMISGRASLNEDTVRRLQALLRPFMLRRLKKDVESQLPSKTEKVVLCRLSRRQRALYDDYMQLAETRERIRVGGAGGIIGVLLALRKVCDHPDLFEERPIVSPLVLDYLGAIRMPVPRLVLLRDNDCRRAGFPVVSFEVWDCNMDGESAPVKVAATASRAGSPRSHSLADPVFDWTPCRLLRLREVYSPVEGLPGSTDRAERYHPSHFPPSFSSDTASLDEEARAESDSKGAVFSLFSRAVHHAHVLSQAARERTVCFQRQRYVEESVARNAYMPSCVRVRLRHDFIHSRAELCPTVADRVEAVMPVVKKVATYVPVVLAAHPPSLHWALPVRRSAAFVVLSRDTVAPLVGFVSHRQEEMADGRQWRRRVYDSSFFLKELWPIHVRRCFSFPDKRLLIYDCGKLQFLESAIKQLQQEGHRMLIFTQFVQMLNILERFLALVGVPYLRLDGATRVDVRQNLVDRFNDDDRITCMILSTRSGGIGLNLTGADTVIFYDSDWNPTMDLQAQDRCHRIGQTKPVTIYRLISEHTVEESILQKARERKKLNNLVIRGGQFHAIAGVGEEYDDSATAYAALSGPVNLRSFFHDLDEDATVSVEEPSAAPYPSSDFPATAATQTTKDEVAMTSAEADVLQEMAQAEDEEDRLAQQQTVEELQQMEAEERAENADDDDADLISSPFSVSGGGGERLMTSSSSPLLAITGVGTIGADGLPLFDGVASLNGGSHDDEHEETEDELGKPLRQATRKRRRETLLKNRTPLDRLLTVRYGVCREDDAHDRYEALVTKYTAQLQRDDLTEEEMEEAVPRFRTELRF